MLDGTNDMVETFPWQAAFTNLPRVAAGGNEIVYTLAETRIGYVDVANGTAGVYTVSINQDARLITNTYVSPTRTVRARKIWSGGPEADHIAPTMNLYRNGRLLEDVQPVITATTDTAREYNYVWSDLPLTDLYGQPYHYYADEASVPEGYGKAVTWTGTATDPYVITNTYSDAVTDIAVQKDWVGGPQPYPPIVLQLQVQRVVEGQTVFVNQGDLVTLNSGNHIHLWRKRPIKDDAGDDFVFRVVETHIGGTAVTDGIAGNYHVTTSGTWSEGFSITNTYVPDDTQVFVSKAYAGGDAATHLRVLVQLFRQAEGGQKEYVGEPVLLSGDDWAYIWPSLPATDMRGAAYVYTVAELNPPAGYGVEITGTGTVDEPFVITNTYGAPVGDITAYKRWSGGFAPIRHPFPAVQRNRAGGRSHATAAKPAGGHLGQSAAV